MGGAPNYSKGRARLQGWANAQRHHESQNIMVRPGKGRYPKCLKIKPYEAEGLCPKETSEDPKNVPKECKFCPEHLESQFHDQMTRLEKLKRLQSIGFSGKIVNERKNN